MINKCDYPYQIDGSSVESKTYRLFKDMSWTDYFLVAFWKARWRKRLLKQESPAAAAEKVLSCFVFNLLHVTTSRLWSHDFVDLLRDI